jgi:hypothetical protein
MEENFKATTKLDDDVTGEYINAVELWDKVLRQCGAVEWVEEHVDFVRVPVFWGGGGDRA